MTDKDMRGTAGDGNGEARWWLDRPGSVLLIVRSLYLVCALLALADLLIDKHGPFAVEHLFAFHAWYGFVACVALVLVAKAMRRVLIRPEDYYDR